MKLQLKHLAPYLAYELKVLHSSNTVMQMNEQRKKGNYLSIEGVIYYAKPILHPISDLTKEIDIDNEKFIPIELIGKLFVEQGNFKNGLFGWDMPTGGGDYQDYYFNITFINDLLHIQTWAGEPYNKFSYIIESHVIEYTIYIQLIKWHFDVFNLIEKKLAIDVNAMK